MCSLPPGPLHRISHTDSYGIYLRADYREADTRKILAEVKAQALPRGERDERTRVWNERFYWLCGLALVLLLPLFRRTLSGYRLEEI